MIAERLPDGTRRIECRPLDGATGALALKFSIACAPQSVQEESLDAWLLERYRLFVGRRDGSVIAAEVEHEPWKASGLAECDIEDGMSGSLGFAVDERGKVGHFSPGVVARFGGFRGVQIDRAETVGTAHPTTVRVAVLRGGR
jgi:uncharacterized protein YqjF (DUF2071 family)